MAVPINANGDGASIAPLDEGITSLRWSPTANFLAATSWDGGCYIWDVKQANHAEPKLHQTLGVRARIPCPSPCVRVCEWYLT